MKHGYGGCDGSRAICYGCDIGLQYAVLSRSYFQRLNGQAAEDGFHGVFQLRPPQDFQGGFSDQIAIRAKHFEKGRVGQCDASLTIENHDALPHRFQDKFQLLLAIG